MEMKAYNHRFINSMVISMLVLALVVISLLAMKIHHEDKISMQEAQDALYYEVTGKKLPKGWREQ